MRGSRLEVEGVGRKGSCYLEEQIVDFILQKVSSSEEQAFRKHLVQCATCRTLFEAWRDTLADYQSEQSDDWAVSRTRVKKYLWSRLNGSFRKKRLDWLRPKPVAAVGIMLVFLSLGMFLKLGVLTQPAPLATPSADGHPLVIKQALPGMLPLATESYYYSIRSTLNPQVDGYIAINPATQEVYIYVKGIPSVVDRDYQAWLVEERSTIDMGLLQLENGIAELYKQAKEVERANMVKISIEPKGGSLYPTGPDLLFIQLPN